MYLEELQRNWNTYGEEDPLWAICSAPQHKENRRDSKNFFESGRGVIKKITQWMDANGLPAKRAVAMDFGCGVGRLTQAMCEYFDLCIGVDIAPSMIAKAKEYNRHGKNCVYRVNETPDLSAFPDRTFDFIYTMLVLQHIRPPVSLRYVSEFVRVLAPGGLAVFQCPSEPATYAYPDADLECKVYTDCDFIELEHSTKTSIPVRVVNTGKHPVGVSDTVNAPIRVVHHWLNRDSGEFHQTHGFMKLPQSVLEPGETMEFDYPVPAPPHTGKHSIILSISDIWNNNLTRDSDLVVVNAFVTPKGANEDNEAETVAVKRPTTEMHFVPVEKVLDVVRAMGGKAVDVKSEQARPGELVSTTYYVTR